MCTKRVHRTNINLSKSSFERTCDDVGTCITSLIICHLLRARSYTMFTKRVFILANSADPDETPRNAASHLGLCCLYMSLFRMHPPCSTSAYFELDREGTDEIPDAYNGPSQTR